MSCNRENIVWQNKDGKWSIGFYDFITTGPDYEWDVEYDFDTFNWGSSGHSTAEAAMNAWDGSNPGCYDLLEYSEASADRIARYNEMLKAWKAEDAKFRAEIRRQPRYYC